MKKSTEQMAEPISYGTCESLEMARRAADEARRDGLLGMYPAACVVLDMQVARLINTAPQEPAVNAELLEALNSIIEFNRQYSFDRYGDADQAETMACVITARAAIAKAGGAA